MFKLLIDIISIQENITDMNGMGPIWWQVNIDSGNNLVRRATSDYWTGADHILRRHMPPLGHWYDLLWFSPFVLKPKYIMILIMLDMQIDTRLPGGNVLTSYVNSWLRNDKNYSYKYLCFLK